MPQYRYSPLSSGPGSIRLLRLMPHEDQKAAIQCDLFEYPLQKSHRGVHLYEALSYVWGNPNKKLPIFINKHNFDVTANLHEALSRLRNHTMERILWVDAICIDQENHEEKEHQIRFMAEIYGQANRVVVWLGEAAVNSDLALEEIRDAGSKKRSNFSNETIQQAALTLLERPWFRRIWILQEVAAARNVLIMCGSTMIDGYAFCLGVDSLNIFYQSRTDLESTISSVTYLIRGAIFRSNYAISQAGRASQNICPLAELIDMYHTHEATKLHDKVYALLGMSSDDLSKANLLPDYRVPWKELLYRLVKHLLSEKIYVETSSTKETAVIKSKGVVLGKVSTVQGNVPWGDRQGVNVTLKNLPGQSEYMGEWGGVRTVQVSAKPIQPGDLICLLQGVSKPMIVRPYRDYFAIIVIAVSPSEDIRRGSEHIPYPTHLLSADSFTRDFLLVWDWGISSEKLQDSGEYETLIRANKCFFEHSRTESEANVDKAIRIWNVALILGDSEEYEMADKRLREAIDGCEMAFDKEHSDRLGTQYGLTPLLWAAGNGYDAIVNQLIMRDEIDPDLKDSQYGWTPLMLAAERGHKPTVELLLKTGKVNINSKNKYKQTPLLNAVARGHKAVVGLLLETGRVDVNSEDEDRQTSLWWAVEGGHEEIVKLLLDIGKVDVEIKDNYGRTALSLAAERGYEAIARLLLETGKVNVDSKDQNGLTPLWWAVMSGCDAVVKLLLETGIVEVDSQDKNGLTPIRRAVENGHETIVMLLLEIGNAAADSKDRYGWTSLSKAAERGYESVVKVLLKMGKVDIDSKDKDGWTPLSKAAARGHEAVVKLLLDTGKVAVDSRDKYGWTPISKAEERGHEAVVKLLRSHAHPSE